MAFLFYHCYNFLLPMDLEITSKEEAYQHVYQSLSGGCVYLHPMHGKDELAENLIACKILADHGHKIEMLPSLPSGEIELRAKLLPDVFNNKNPDVRINNQFIGDIKTPEKELLVKKSTISRQILSAAKQKVPIAILNLYERAYTVRDIKKGIVGALQPDRNKSIEQVWVITQKRNLFTITRPMVFNDLIYETLTTL